MGFLFKKKKVPEELPDLAIDEISEKEISGNKRADAESGKEKKFKPLPAGSSQSSYNSDNSSETPKTSQTGEADKGFFKDVLKAVTEETKNIDKLDLWYKNKFLPQDIVSQMRDYWEKQSPEVILKSIGVDLKDKLMGKIDNLHDLEKEWQEIYFKLIAKEEEIRKEEKELKDSLSEIITLFKKSVGKKDKKDKRNR